MIHVRTRHDYQGSPEQVWAITKKFGDPTPFPEGVSLSGVRGHGVGSVRTVHLPDGERVTERIEAIDEQNRTLRYTVEQTTLPFRNYHAMMRVVPHDDGSCEVQWTASFDAPAEAAEPLAAETKAFFDAVLDKGAARFEKP